jgi:hypothetical protein
MTFFIMVSLCIATWILTLDRLQAIHWKEIRKDNGIALYVWLMMLCFSITMIFLVKRFADYFDAHTANNLDRLIAYCSILTGIFFGASASTEAVGKPNDRKTIKWLKGLLVLIIVTLLALYIFFISKLPNINYFVPRSLPEVYFMLATFIMGAALCGFVDKLYIAYLPQENSPVMRVRTILIIVSTFIAGLYFLVKIIVIGGYFWPVFGSPILFNFSMILLVVSAILHFSALLSNRLYIPLVLITRNIEGWNTFKDLKYMTDRIQQLCPEFILPTPEPLALDFILDPEYHLYNAVITILDGKTILDDLLFEGAFKGEPALWEGDMLREAVQVKQALQIIHHTDDFWQMVKEYRQASRKLICGQGQNFSQESM